MKRLLVGITGASGVVYGIRLLMALRDAVKEVAIFKSHKSIPIVICTEGFDAFERIGQRARLLENFLLYVVAVGA